MREAITAGDVLIGVILVGCVWLLATFRPVEHVVYSADEIPPLEWAGNRTVKVFEWAISEEKYKIFDW